MEVIILVVKIIELKMTINEVKRKDMIDKHF